MGKFGGTLTVTIKKAGDWLFMFVERHFLVLLLFILAIGVRIYQFGAVPGGFNQDEAIAAYDAYMVARYGMDRFQMRLPIYFTAWGFGQQSAFMHYTMVPFFWVMGLTVTAARLPVLIFSLLGLFAMYKFVDDAFGKKPITLAVLAFGAINPWHIMQSRWALDCNMFPHLMMMGCWFLYRGIKALETQNHVSAGKPKAKAKTASAKKQLFNPWLAASMVAFSFCLYAYGIALYSVPVFLLAMAVYLLVIDKERYLVPLLISFGVFMLISWPIFAMVYINLFELPSFSVFGFTVPFFPYTARAGDLLFFADDRMRQLGWNARSLSHILLQQDDAPWNAISGFGTLFKWSVPFTAFGLFTTLSARKSLGKTILLYWLAMAIFAGLVVRGVNVNRGNILFYPLIIITGIGLYEVAMLAKKTYVRWAVVAAMIVVGGLSFGFFTRSYFGEHNRALTNMFFADFFQTVDAVQEKDYDRLYVTMHVTARYQGVLSEVLWLFGARTEPTLFWDQETFRDRYRFRNFHAVPYPPESPDINVLYIFNVHEAHFFPHDLFEITWIESFGVARFRETG